MRKLLLDQFCRNNTIDPSLGDSGQKEHKMSKHGFAPPPAAFEKGKPSATDLMNKAFRPNLDVEAARAAMVAAGQQPGNPRIKAANEARRAAFRDSQLAGLPISEAKIASQQAYEAVVNG